MLKYYNVHLRVDVIHYVGWIYYSTERGTLFPQNWELSKQSGQRLRGLAREILQQLLQEKQDRALLADLLLTHFATYLLIGACRITPWCLVCLINSRRSIYLSFASPFTPCYFQLMVHVWSSWESGSEWSMLHIYSCHCNHVTSWPWEVKMQNSSLGWVRSLMCVSPFSPTLHQTCRSSSVVHNPECALETLQGVF